MRLWEIVGLEELIPFTTKFIRDLGGDMYTNYGEIYPYRSLPQAVLRGAYTRLPLGSLNYTFHLRRIKISTHNQADVGVLYTRFNKTTIPLMFLSLQ